MTYQIRPAVRENVKPLIGLYGLSGCGKTYSALLLARGLVGPNGKIVMIDTESGRGELYADVIPGGYDVLRLEAPFAPARYVEALHDAERAGAGAIIIDSVSHVWEGLGGVLAMATEIEARTGKAGLHCWKEPKLQHSRFVLALLQSPCPVICCLRAKHKSRQVRNAKTGKSEIVKDDFTTPIASDDFIFEMTVHGEILQDHSFRLTKASHPQLAECLSAAAPITIGTGETLAAWAAGSAPAAPPDALETARLAARSGRAAFEAWWKGEGKPHRAAVTPHLTELQALVKAAEAPHEDEPPDLLAAG